MRFEIQKKPVPYQVQQLDIVSNSNNTATIDNLVTIKEKKLPHQVQQLDIVSKSNNTMTQIAG